MQKLDCNKHKRSEPNASSTPSAWDSIPGRNSMHCFVPWINQPLVVVSSYTPSIGIFGRDTVALQISNIRGRLSIESINSQSHQDTLPSSQHAKTTTWCETRGGGTVARTKQNCWHAHWGGLMEEKILGEVQLWKRQDMQRIEWHGKIQGS